jgi:hypothetical protein
MPHQFYTPSWFPATAAASHWIGQQPPAANEANYPDPFVSFKGRPAPRPGQRVRVHRNLNRPSYYSLRMLEGPTKGKVVGYAPATCLHDVKLAVSEPGRNRVLRDKQRNVHAWAEGIFETCTDAPPLPYQRRDVRRHTYFPFNKGHFFDRTRPDQPVTEIQRAWITGADILALPEIV